MRMGGTKTAKIPYSKMLQDWNEKKKTCINKDFHIHQVPNTLIMEYQYALQNNYIRSIYLPTNMIKKLTKRVFFIVHNFKTGIWKKHKISAAKA